MATRMLEDGRQIEVCTACGVDLGPDCKPGLFSAGFTCGRCGDKIRRNAAAALGSIGGKAGRGESKKRGDSAYYRALRTGSRDYVADRRQYDSQGRRVTHSGGWAVVRWDEARQIWIEPAAYYATKREALEALRTR